MGTDLTFVPTKELLTEIGKRFDDMVFLGAVRRTPDEDGVVCSVRGPFHACLGLAEMLKESMLRGEHDDCTD